MAHPVTHKNGRPNQALAAGRRRNFAYRHLGSPVRLRGPRTMAHPAPNAGLRSGVGGLWSVFSEQSLTRLVAHPVTHENVRGRYRDRNRDDVSFDPDPDPDPEVQGRRSEVWGRRSVFSEQPLVCQDSGTSLSFTSYFTHGFPWVFPCYTGLLWWNCPGIS